VAVAKGEACRDRRVAVVSAAHGCPPSDCKRQDQPGGGNEPREDRGTSGFVGGRPRVVYRLVHAPFGFRLRNARPLRDQLGELRPILRGD
jgi:hypothetical protein